MTTSTIIILAVMILAFIGMIICAKKQKSNPNAKTLSIVCLVVVLICAVLYLKDQGAFGGMSSEMKGILASYERFNEATAKKAAEFVLAEPSFKGKKIVIVATGGNAWATTENKLANYVKNYLKDANVEIKGLPYDPPKNDTGATDEFLNAKYFNKLFKENKDAAAFIMTIGLPYDPSQLSKLTIWKEVKGPKLILINSDLHMLGQEIQKGTIAAAIVMRTDLKKQDFEKMAPGDLDQAFADRYLMVTSKNLKEISQKHGSLFKM